MATGHSEADISFPPFVLDAEIPLNALIVSQGGNPNADVNLVVTLHREPDGNILVINVVSFAVTCRG